MLIREFCDYQWIVCLFLSLELLAHPSLILNVGFQIFLGKLDKVELNKNSI